MAQFLAPTLIGAALFLFGWFQFRKVRASRSWPAAPGRIIAGNVTYESSRDEDGDSGGYFPAVQYEYQVGGQTFRGGDIAFERRGYQTEAKARQAIAALQPGAPVQVFYNPARPEAAVLERKAPAGFVLMIVGLLIAAAGAAAALKQ